MCIRDRLVYLKQDGTYEPRLADKWSMSDDNKVLTVHLNEKDVYKRQAVKLFLMPAGLLTGGTTGIGLALNRSFGIPVATFVLIFNVTRCV